MSNIQVTPQEVKAMGAFCKAKAGEIELLAKAIDTKVRTVDWKSGAKGRFDGDWGSHMKNLGLLQRSLNELGLAAEKMGDNYERADDAYKA